MRPLREPPLPELSASAAPGGRGQSGGQGAIAGFPEFILRVLAKPPVSGSFVVMVAGVLGVTFCVLVSLSIWFFLWVCPSLWLC